MSDYIIRLECKSVKQLKRTCEQLDELGVEKFLLSPEEQSVGIGRGVSFYVWDGAYTCGRQGVPEGQDEMYRTRKEFIEAVKRVLGESK
ncbi:hypothetical protein Aristophanes_00012 [Acinetobacter phage Aristophanes]|uniref:Uncharacterized protein n=1 Tax=Acinetobacter phage Aristophanes TaxID=2759203 RepID=A0A7G9VYM1_BPACA|nr:hypothetical protein Aristophanes_00012 [Acinetobacter phage Aristophanes]